MPHRSRFVSILLVTLLCSATISTTAHPLQFLLPSSGQYVQPVTQSESLEADSSELDRQRHNKKEEVRNAREAMEDMRSDMMLMGGFLVLMTIGVGGYLLMKRIRNRDQ